MRIAINKLKSLYVQTFIYFYFRKNALAYLLYFMKDNIKGLRNWYWQSYFPH